jgi:hypothetical protein
VHDQNQWFLSYFCALYDENHTDKIDAQGGEKKQEKKGNIYILYAEIMDWWRCVVIEDIDQPDQHQYSLYS